MKPNWYTILLYILKSLIYAKRGLVYVLSWIWRGLLWFNVLYKRSIGFRFYQYTLWIKKWVGKIGFLRHYSHFEIIGQRATLQAVVAFIFVLVMIPHSKLKSQQSETVAGKNTLLYGIVGPGPQDFSLADAMSEVMTTQINVETWKSGSVVSHGETTNLVQAPSELTGITSGGMALNKPIVMSGVDISSMSGGGRNQNRTEVAYYEVKQGDVIGAIAEQFGVSIETILWANNLTARSYIRPGDKLTILPVDGLVHKVVSGDTLTKIAKKYEADKEQIVSFNKLQADGSDLVVGEELVVPGGRKPQEPRVVYKPQPTSRPSALNKVAAPLPSVTAPAGSGYVWPSAATIITQYYNWRHNGLDIAGKIGTPVYATRAGTIKVSQCGWNGGYGCWIKIDHGDGIESRYGHNSELLVSVGDYVEQGQLISYMGSTGNSTGPHVHFEIRVNGANVNPLSYVRK